MKVVRKPRIRRFLRRLFLLAGILFVSGFGLLVYCNLLPVWASQGHLFNSTDDIPSRRVGLIFGTDSHVGVGRNLRENLYFRYRIDAAVRLWRAGKVQYLIVSGDNRRKDYNEPAAMRLALMAEGVPQDRIVEDFAGLRTFDSVVRAKEIFGVTELVFISQRFQNERAVYIAKANGIDAIAFNAQDIPGSGGYKTKLREVGARGLMWLDVMLLGTRPKVLGPPIRFPKDGK